MKQGMQLRFSQNLSLTPQLQQAIRLLQLSTLELNQEIDVLMQTNPLLERGEAGEDEYGNLADDGADQVAAHEKTNEALHDDVQKNGQDDTPDYAKDTENFNTDFSERGVESSQIDANKVESSEPADFDIGVSATDFSSEFSDEFDEFSNGSRWDENSTPADDDSDFKQQETLQVS